jgi:hypothetical protein
MPLSLILTLLCAWLFLPAPVSAQTTSDWYMSGANPGRTGWVATSSTNQTEIRGALYPQWFLPFEPYIPPKAQLVAVNGVIYVPTAKGLYAVNAANGSLIWTYPTAQPLGQSPTVVGDTVYVAGYDKQLHAINVSNGQRRWAFTATQGFQTNPLVVNGVVYVGNRNGKMYAVNASTGAQIWEYQTDGPILFSAAFADSRIYFASNDMHAYALNTNGTLAWRTGPLPGGGFHSWWPVIYQDNVILIGSMNYGAATPYTANSFSGVFIRDIWPGGDDNPNAGWDRGDLAGLLGSEPGNWQSGTQTIDVSKSNKNSTPLTSYFQDPETYHSTDPAGLNRHTHKPWRRTYFVLNRTNGQERKYDLDGDGRAREYAPIIFLGNDGLFTGMPPVIGGDGVIYQSTMFKYEPYFAGGHISGWKIGTPFISHISRDWGAGDENHAYISAGNLIYWEVIIDRQAGAIDLTSLWGTAPNFYREYGLHAYNLYTRAPGYDTDPNQRVWQYFLGDMFGDVHARFGNNAGTYGYHGEISPPIPHRGMLYTVNGNGLMAWGPTNSGYQELGMARNVSSQTAPIIPARTTIVNELRAEVQKIIDAGHLRPGYYNAGHSEFRTRACFEYNQDYFSHPADTIYALTRVLSLPDADIPSTLKTQLRTYIQSEFTNYPPYTYNHIGWRDGAFREYFTLPPEVLADTPNYPPTTQRDVQFNHWNFNPYSFYAVWKYAAAGLAGNSSQIQTLFNSANNRIGPVLNNPPADSTLISYPWILNAYIAGYTGYLETQSLLGQSQNSTYVNQRNRLLDLYITNLSLDSTLDNRHYCRTYNTSRFFIYLTPEQAQMLRARGATATIQSLMNQYYQLIPNWFVTRHEATYGESSQDPEYTYYALFQAKAKILQEPYQALAPYLDVPAFKQGDLFHIHNLAAALEAPQDPNYTPPPTQPASSPTPTPSYSLDNDNDVDIFDILILISRFTQNLVGDFNQNGRIDIFDFNTLLKNRL